MMNLFIEVDADGNCINHPAYEYNLIQAFHRVPDHWEPFVRVEHPNVGVYEVLQNEEPIYEKINGVWTDVWHVRAMTPDEKAAKQQSVINAFNNRPQSSNWSAWYLDEDTCTMKPPIPRPNDEQQWRWCGAENSWKLAPDYPTDGKQYIFDFSKWVWVVAGTQTF